MVKGPPTTIKSDDECAPLHRKRITKLANAGTTKTTQSGFDVVSPYTALRQRDTVKIIIEKIKNKLVLINLTS
jgi:hypothetical protein